MENRLYLNKKVNYILPNEIIISDYRRGVKEPNFKPDIVISYRGNIGISEAGKTHKQFWVKTSNKNILNFLKEYNYNLLASKTMSVPYFTMIDFKKIIWNEFYNR